MRNSKLISSAALAICAVVGSGAASAADLPARTYTKAPTMMAAVYDWSGLYVGVNGGWGSSHKCWDRNTGLGGTFAAADGCHDATGGVAGGQVGYRWQSSAWVFGIEAQGDWANLRGSSVSLIPAPPTNPVIESRINAFGLFTGQIGYAVNTVLLYAKGGAAVVSDKYRDIAPLTNTTFDTANETRWGATVGVGVEYAFAPNWSAALEYDHLFMGSRTLDFYSALVPGTFTREDVIHQNVDIVTARVNYRWGGPVAARY